MIRFTLFYNTAEISDWGSINLFVELHRCDRQLPQIGSERRSLKVLLIALKQAVHED